MMDMPEEAGHPEINQLRAGMNDLVALLGLSATWSGERPADIARTLGEALLAMLSLDFIWIELVIEGEERPITCLRHASDFPIDDPRGLDGALRERLGADGWPHVSRQHILGREVSVHALGLGVGHGFGTIAAASGRPDFPGDTERLIMNMARNQALLVLQQAALLRAQQRRARELHRHVEARTAELAAANDALISEIAERRRAEAALQASILSATSLIDGLPGLVATLGADGRVERVNRRIVDYCGLPLEELRNWGTNGTVHPDDMPHVAEIFGRSIASGKPYVIEQRLRRFDGEYRWFDNRGLPIHNEAGEVVGWHVLLSDVHSRRRAEDELAASEQNLQVTIDTIPALVWSALPDGTADFFNQHYLDYVGLPPDAMRDWQWTQLVHPDDLGVIAAAWERARLTRSSTEAEARLRRADGVYRWFLFRSSPLRDAGGNAVKWFGVASDIEDRRRATLILDVERRLLEMIASGHAVTDVANAICRVVEEVMPASICELRLIDRNSPTIDFAVAPSLPAAYVKDVVGTKLRDDLLPCGLAFSLKRPVAVADIGEDPRWQGSAVRAGLLERGLRAVLSTPILSSEEGVLGTLCLYHRQPTIHQPEHQDFIGRVTHIASIALDRLRAEDELRRRAYLLDTAERITQTGSFSWDMKNNKLFWSTQMYRIWELEEGLDPTQQNLIAMVHPDDRPLVEAKVTRAFNGEGSPDTIERLVMPDGRIKYLSQAYRVIHHEDGRLESVGVSQDITVRRHAEDALESVRSELAHVTRVTSLGELAASITHEVNQPLTGIIANASASQHLLTAEPPDIDSARRAIQRTIRDGIRASDVIQRLRELFRRQDFVAEAIDLNNAADDVIAICTHDLRRRRIALEVNLASGLPPVIGDRIQLQQVILNLVMNAADALEGIEERPRVISILTLAAEPGFAQLTVRDTGRGLTTEEAAKVFDAFFTTKPNGMGIGLSVSRSIVERHKGRLWVDSNADDGAAFSFSLPCAGRKTDDPASAASAQAE